MCHSYLEVGKTDSQLFRARQTLLQLFGDRKMWIPAIRRPKNVVNKYLRVKEKLVPSQQEHEKNVSQLCGSGKNWFLAISSLTNTVSVVNKF